MSEERSEMHEEPRRGLVAAILAGLHKKVGRKDPGDVVDRIMGEVLKEMPQATAFNWDSSEPMTVAQARRMAHIGKVIRIVGHVSELHTPQAVAFPNASGDLYEVDATCVKITDSRGDSIWSLDVIGAELIDPIRNSVGNTAEFLGIVVALPAVIDPRRPDRGVGIERRDFLLHVLDVRPGGCAFDLLGATREERDRAKQSNRTGFDLNGRSRRWLPDYASKIVVAAGVDGGFQRSGSSSARSWSAVLSMRSRMSARYSTGFTPTRVQETTSE